MRVRDILKDKGTTVVSVHGDVPLPGAVEILSDKRIGAVVVVNRDEQVVGILSERDVVLALGRHGADALKRQVREVMTEHVFVCKPDDQIKDVMAWMTRHRVRHLPVFADGQLEGIISIGDVVKSRLGEMETEAGVLRDIILAR